MKSGIAQVFYYPFESKPLRARQVRKLWKQLAVLRSPLYAYVHQDLALDSIPEKATHIHSGNLSAFDKLLPDVDGDFFGGFEFIEGFTAGRRDYNYSTGKADNTKRFDLLMGVKVGWVLPFYKQAPEKFYTY